MEHDELFDAFENGTVSIVVHRNAARHIYAQIPGFGPLKLFWRFINLLTCLLIPATIFFIIKGTYIWILYYFIGFTVLMWLERKMMIVAVTSFALKDAVAYRTFLDAGVIMLRENKS